MSSPPEVSIIIPFYNGGSFIDGAFNQINCQTFRNFEVIVVDDGSRPQDAEQAQGACLRHGGRYFRQKNGGPASARNTGVRHANGRWIAFLDVDDRWSIDKLEKQYAIGCNGYELVICDCETIDKFGAIIVKNYYSKLDSTSIFLDNILKGNIYSFTSAIFISTRSFREIGGFDERLKFWEDHFFLYRCVRELRCSYIGEALSRRVIHSESTSHPSRNLNVDALVERRRLFFDAIVSIYPDVRKNPYLSQNLRSAAKMSIALGDRRKALKLSVGALRMHPSTKSLFFVAAILATFMKKDLFKNWYPELRSHAVSRSDKK